MVPNQKKEKKNFNKKDTQQKATKVVTCIVQILKTLKRCKQLHFSCEDGIIEDNYLTFQLLPGVKVVIANPETKGQCADSHLGEVCT